jgi:hypothetical protein
MSCVVFIVLGDDRVISRLKGVPVRLYIVWGTRLHGSSSRIQAQKSYPSTFRVVFYHLRLVLLLYE